VTATGYSSKEYASALREFGDPWFLSESRGWILKRAIPGTSERDAMGCYPLFTCEDWSKLARDVDNLSGDLLTLAMVPDPFAPLSPDELRGIFDVVVDFKPHFIFDLDVPLDKGARRHHRYYGRRALASMKVERCEYSASFLAEWVELYGVLARRHAITGIKAFSPTSFRRQLEVPGVVAFRVTHEDRLVAAQLWFVQGNVAYSHLTASSEDGYRLRATYGLHHYVINYFAEHFRGVVRWLDLGGGAGLAKEGQDGLTEFKRGWATGVRQAYFCGRTFDEARYAALSAAVSAPTGGYFPAYRQRELLRPADATAAAVTPPKSAEG
jgi:Acetyltransferase (GNAT) domain